VVELGLKRKGASSTLCPKKRDCIFYYNKCPITIIFGIVSSQVYASSNDGLISHLTYLVQLPYLGKS